MNVDTEQAFILYKESSDKGYFPAKYSLAYLYMKKATQTDSAENYRQAANLFIQCLQKDPSYTDAYFYLG